MSTEVKIVKDKTFETIKSAVDQMVDFIKPTYGPANNKVVISKIPYRMIVDDGVQIARDFELPDPAENAIVQVIREVAVRTNDRVGDGTTSSLIMLQAIIDQVSHRKRDGRKVEKELVAGLEDVKKQIKEMTTPIESKEDLKKVAMVSFDNEKIAEMIAELYSKIGKDGVITIDRSPTMQTTTEMTDGIKVENGYISPYMIINPERMETVLEKPYILITDYRMTEVNDVIKLMEKMSKDNKKELVIIAEGVEQSALSTIIINKMQGKFLIVAVNAPKGENNKIWLEDLAMLTGAKMFSEAKGDKLENVEISDLGRAAKFICRRDESIVVDPKGDKESIDTAIFALRKNIQEEESERIKKELEKRLSMFTNKVAVIKVGAPTENELKALKYKVEDVVNSVKAAYNSGVVCGAGLALARINTSSQLLNEALQYPARQLRDNMGLDEIELEPNSAENVVTGKIGGYMEVGVIDPSETLLAGVESAVSIASVLVTSCGMLVEAEKKPPIVRE